MQAMLDQAASRFRRMKRILVMHRTRIRYQVPEKTTTEVVLRRAPMFPTMSLVIPETLELMKTTWTSSTHPINPRH